MSAVRPTVRSLIVCESILPEPDHPTRVSLIRLVDSIRPSEGSTYPLLQPHLSVFAQLTECRGSVRLQIRVHVADADHLVFTSPMYTTTFPNEPLTLHGARFRILKCRFPNPGLYWVQIWINDELSAQTPLILR